MTSEEIQRLSRGTLLVTPFIGKGIVSLVGVGIEIVEVQYLHDHGGQPSGSIGRYLIKELTTLEAFRSGSPCMDGEGHVSHDFLGHFCIRCGLSDKAIDFLKTLRAKGQVPN